MQTELNSHEENPALYNLTFWQNSITDETPWSHNHLDILVGQMYWTTVNHSFEHKLWSIIPIGYTDQPIDALLIGSAKSLTILFKSKVVALDEIMADPLGLSCLLY